MPIKAAADKTATNMLKTDSKIKNVLLFFTMTLFHYL